MDRINAINTLAMVIQGTYKEGLSQKCVPVHNGEVIYIGQLY